MVGCKYTYFIISVCSFSASHLRGIVLCFWGLCDPIWGHFHPPEPLVLCIHQPGWLMLAAKDWTTLERCGPHSAHVLCRPEWASGRRRRKKRERWIHQHNKIKRDSESTCLHINWICDIESWSGFRRGFSPPVNPLAVIKIQCSEHQHISVKCEQAASTRLICARGLVSLNNLHGDYLNLPF